MKKIISSFTVVFGFLVFFITGSNLAVAASVPGAVVAWGWNNFDQISVPADLSGVTAIAAGLSHTVALKNDGTVVAWGGTGGNDWGQTTAPLGLSGVIAVTAGGYHTTALKSNGTVVAWGMNIYGQTTVPVGLSGVTAVAAGVFHTVALKSDGTVVAWGNNDFEQTIVPAGLSGVVAIAAGPLHTLALKSDGTVVGWGLNNYGQTTFPAGLSGVVAIAAGADHTIALKSDGTVVGWGRNDGDQITIPVGLSGVTAITAGQQDTLVLKSDGTVMAWGRNDHGQTTVPTGLSGVTAIAAGAYHAVAIVALDTTPPVLNVPSSIFVNATSPTGTELSYSVTATDNVTLFPEVICTPASGSVFPLGTTTVMCTATDAALNSTTASFTVTVKNPIQMITDISLLVHQINAGQGVINNLNAKLQKAITSLNAMNANSVTIACNQLNAFINKVQAQSGKAITVAQANQLIAAAIQVRLVLGCF